MNASSSTIWHRPRLYGAIVGLYFLVISGVIVGYLIIIAIGECLDCSNPGKAMMLASLFIPTGFILVLPILAGVWLIKRSDASYMKGLGYGVLIFLTIGGIWSYVVVTANAGEDELKQRPPTDLRFWYTVISTMLGVNGIMFVLLHKRYSGRILA